jgi:VirB8 protein
MTGRMTMELKEVGLDVCERRVGRLMRISGIKPVRTRKHKVTTNSNHSLGIVANVLDGNFTADALNRKWAGDISYIWTAQGWLYLAVILDLHSRRVSAPQPWMAVIKYRYSGEPMRAEDRYVNPLGFQVIKYTRNPEALPPPAPPAPITEQEIGAQPESASDTQLINPEAAAVTAPELGEHVIHRLRPVQ